MKYTDEICQGCGEKFCDKDDIVVCPECGTPQHRACYNKENKCVNEHLHSENYEWKPRHSAPSQAEKSRPRQTCPFCGHENAPDAKACENCGQPFEFLGRKIIFGENGDSLGESTDKTDDDAAKYRCKPPFDVSEFVPDENGYEPNADDENGLNFNSAPLESFDDLSATAETCGVPNRELFMFVGTNTFKYRQKFTKLQDKKPTFNFGAFVFGYIWYFFRKLYKQGFVFMALAICLTIGFYNPIKEANDALSSKMSVVQEALTQIQDGTLTEEEENAILNEMEELVDEYSPVLMAYLGCNLALNLVAALLADRIYKKKVIGEIESINEEHAGNDRARLGEFIRKGGTSFTMALCGYVLHSAIISIVSGVFLQ